MLIRLCRTLAVATACLLAVVGGVVLAAVSPGALIVVVATGSIVGIITARNLPGTEPPDALVASSPIRHLRGVGAAAVTVAALLAMVGSTALLGSATPPVLLLLLLAAGAGLWRHRSAGRASVTALAGDAAAPPAIAPPPLPGTLTVRALCLAWQRSDCSLDGLPTGAARTELMSSRERLLDELERRDPIGFDRWMHRGAYASSDPSHYLTDDRPSTAWIPRGNDPSAS